MKTIKIFIASSEELHRERIEFTFIIQRLNKALKLRNIKIEPVKWEYLDASMGSMHKQEEYNRKLKNCEWCIVLFWNKFGEFTENELNIAYEELKVGGNLKKLYVYFKEPTIEISEDLKNFKKQFFTRYGYFYCRFDNIDMMRFHFLLQLEDYYKQSTRESLLKVQDSKIKIDGMTVAEFPNASFATNNPNYFDLFRK